MAAAATPSEILIFQRLANPARVNKVPRKPSGETFRSAVQNEVRHMSSQRAAPASGTMKTQPPPPSRHQHPKQQDDGGGTASSEDDEEEPPFPDRAISSSADAPVAWEAEHHHRSSSQQQQSREAQMEALAEQEQEKLGMIDFINKKAQRGVRTTKAYTADDRFDEIQFEYDRIKSNEDTNGAVNIMREGLRFLAQGIEMGNDKFGPVLSLNRWVETKLAPDSMARFDPVLEKLYKKHWRKGSMAPELELLMLLGGSMAMHHFETVRNPNGAAGGGGGRDPNAPFARQHAPGGGGQTAAAAARAPPSLSASLPFSVLSGFGLTGGAGGGGGGGGGPVPTPAAASSQALPGGRPVMRGPVDTRQQLQLQHHQQQEQPEAQRAREGQPDPQADAIRAKMVEQATAQAQLDEMIKAQHAQFRALETRSAMLAIKQRELDAFETRMERSVPAAMAAAATAFSSSSSSGGLRVIELREEVDQPPKITTAAAAGSSSSSSSSNNEGGAAEEGGDDEDDDGARSVGISSEADGDARSLTSSARGGSRRRRAPARGKP